MIRKVKGYQSSWHMACTNPVHVQMQSTGLFAHKKVKLKKQKEGPGSTVELELGTYVRTCLVNETLYLIATTR